MKVNKIFPLLLIIFLIGCKSKTEESDKVNLSIEKFDLISLDNNGKKIYSINSPYSQYDNIFQIYLLNDVKVNFYENEKKIYTVTAKDAKLVSMEKIILNGNVIIEDLSEDKTTINAAGFSWDLNNSNFILEGNVTLKNNVINLNSGKAILDKKTNIIKFYKPVNYFYNEENNSSKYNISSENAYYNLKDKSVIFKSESKRVKSTIIF